jgi:hypothetical protein
MYSTNEKEWTIYHPPKSVSFGHQSRVRDRRRAWAMTDKFLTELTTPKLIPGIDLECVADPAMIPQDIATACVSRAQQLFGGEQNPSGPIRRWSLTEEQLPDAVQLALDVDQWPPQPCGAVRLHFGYSFAWRELTDRSPPSGHVGLDPVWVQDASTLGVIIDQKQIFLQPTFVFPFARGSSKFEDFFSRVDKLCPFRFRDAYFKPDHARPQLGQ